MKSRSEIIAESLAHARAGLAVAIVSVEGRHSLEVMGMLVDEVADAKRVVRTSGQQRVDFPSGGRVSLYSQRQADSSLRGALFDRVYVDVMPMVLATAGMAGKVEAFA